VLLSAFVVPKLSVCCYLYLSAAYSRFLASPEISECKLMHTWQQFTFLNSPSPLHSAVDKLTGETQPLGLEPAGEDLSLKRKLLTAEIRSRT